MSELALSIAITNFTFTAFRFYRCLKAGRLMSIAWFIIAYFSWFFIFTVTKGAYKHYRGFTNDYLLIKQDDIDKTLVYVIAFNVLFFVTEFCIWKIIGIRKGQEVWFLPAKSSYLNRIQFWFLALLALGTGLYGTTTWNHNYRDYVEFEGSSWGIVFLWASTPFITIAALRNKYWVALLACLPFIYFAVHLKIRSFALLSLIPVAIIYLLQLSVSGDTGVLKKLKKIIGGVCLALVLVILSSGIIADKTKNINGGFEFPDSGMPFGAVIIIKATDQFHAATNWDALSLYGHNLINPFLLLLGIHTKPIVDPPVLMAQLLDGVPKNWDTYFHYPTLWYADAYLAFGDMGLLLAILWAVILVVWEAIMARNILLFSLLVPFYTWNIYMLIRGAIAGSTVPFSYAVYVTFIIAVLTGGIKIFKGNRSRAKSTASY